MFTTINTVHSRHSYISVGNRLHILDSERLSQAGNGIAMTREVRAPLFSFSSFLFSLYSVKLRNIFALT